MVVQAKAPAGANGSTTSGFVARVLDAKTPLAPYYHDADGDGIGAGEVEWYAPGDEPSGWVSRGGPDNFPEASNANQTDTDACEAPVVSDPVLTDPRSPRRASRSQPTERGRAHSGRGCNTPRPFRRPQTGPWSPSPGAPRAPRGARALLLCTLGVRGSKDTARRHRAPPRDLLPEVLSEDRGGGAGVGGEPV